MYLTKAPNILTRISKSIIWKINTTEKKIFLTFDDGPHPTITQEVLAILKDYRAKATFFCLGSNAKEHPGIIDKIISEDHAIGNHTYSHMNGWVTKSRDYIEDVFACEDYLKTVLFRPPYGRIKPVQIKQLKRNFHIILWTVISGDFDVKLKPEKCLESTIENSGSGSIIVFHDSEKAKERVLFSLPAFLEKFSKSGYKFESISEDYLKL